jgi:hypothetical protein
MFREYNFSENQMIFSWLIPKSFMIAIKKFKSELVSKLIMVLSYYPTVF